MPGPYLAADGFAVSAGAVAAGFSADGAGVVAGEAGFSAEGAGDAGAGVSGAGVAGGGVVGAGVAAGGSVVRAGSCGAPQPAAANVSAHTKPRIPVLIAHSFLDRATSATSYQLRAAS